MDSAPDKQLASEIRYLCPRDIQIENQSTRGAKSILIANPKRLVLCQHNRVLSVAKIRLKREHFRRCLDRRSLYRCRNPNGATKEEVPIRCPIPTCQPTSSSGLIKRHSRISHRRPHLLHCRSRRNTRSASGIPCRLSSNDSE